MLTWRGSRRAAWTAEEKARVAVARMDNERMLTSAVSMEVDECVSVRTREELGPGLGGPHDLYTNSVIDKPKTDLRQS